MDKKNNVKNEIANLLEQRESDTVEFKRTLRLPDDRPDEAKENVKNEIAKSLAGFLNSRNGGTLIIGVKDDGEPTGRLLEAFISEDEDKNKDKAIQYLIDIMSEKLGLVPMTQMSFDFGKTKGELILVIRCMFDNTIFPVFVSQSQPPKDRFFYVRIGTTTRQLSGEDQRRYIESVLESVPNIESSIESVLESVPNIESSTLNWKKVQYGVVLIVLITSIALISIQLQDWKKVQPGAYEDKKTFFDLGIAFVRFSTMPDEDEYEIIYKVASRLELEIPDYSELLVELGADGIVTPPSEWFEGADGESRRNYSRIGALSFGIFLLGQGDEDIDDRILQELIVLFRVEDISTQILDDYVVDLKTGNAAGAFRGFVIAFYLAIPSEEHDNDLSTRQ